MRLPNRADETLLPAMLAVALAFGLLFQFSDGDGDAVPVPRDGAGRAVALAGVQVRATDAAIGPAVVDPVLLTDPVFSEARAGKQADAAQAGPLGGAVIVGTTRGRGFARAIVQPPGGAAVSVAVGGRYLGWRLAALSADAVLFRRGAETLRMPLGGAYGQPGFGARPNLANER